MNKKICPWKRADESIRLDHCPENAKERIFYARQYTPGKGYEHSDTNQLITNFQMGPGAPPNRQVHRTSAIEKFASELSEFMTWCNSADWKFYLIAMPTSKRRDNPEFDDRLEQTVRRTSQRCSWITVLPLIETVKEIPRAKENRSTRSVAKVLETLELNKTAIPNLQGNVAFFLVDDILTSGAHFQACRELIQSEVGQIEVVGAFWAKSVAPNPFEELSSTDQ